MLVIILAIGFAALLLKIFYSWLVIHSYKKKAESSVDKLSWTPDKNFYKALRPMNTATLKTMLYSFLGCLAMLLLVSYIFFAKDALYVGILVVAVSLLQIITYVIQHNSAPSYCFDDTGIWTFHKLYFGVASKSKLFVPWSQIGTYTVYDKHHVNIYTVDNKDLDLIISGNGIDQVAKYLDHYIQPKI